MVSPPLLLTLQATLSGTYTLPVPHCVHLFIGETLITKAHVIKESNNLWKVNCMMLLGTNIDNMLSVNHLAFCVEQLLLQGAADAWVTSIVMKKGRTVHSAYSTLPVLGGPNGRALAHCLSTQHHAWCLFTIN
jgi:uncharacterized protein (DUF111 family)